MFSHIIICYLLPYDSWYTLGRLDRAIYVGLPCPRTRRAIIEMRTKRMTLAEEDIVEKLVSKTEGMVTNDLGRV